jgi:CyaY protein
MSEQEFLVECDRILDSIEDALDAADVDIDTQRSGHLIELEFIDGSKIIVNGNAPVREMWVAAKAGGFHFRKQGGQWLDSRRGEELFAELSRWVSQQAGVEITLGAG